AMSVDVPGVAITKREKSSAAQLAHIMEAVYSVLQRYEEGCMDLDKTIGKAERINNGQCQAAHALHQALLAEHMEYLSCTIHPSATPEIKALPTQCRMLQRLWQHGIRDFLDALRLHAPETNVFAESFVISSYQFFGYLLEVVQDKVMTPFWLVCLGELAAKYASLAVSIEERLQWTKIAQSWLTEALYRAPYIGRAQHCLGAI
ncbi:hypothetical protein BAUCODRAFT_52663, partial [Baudoinia panamericana UAMH 10762]